jgi:putative tryptophan/tyrosine transport system substrate-binding protein
MLRCTSQSDGLNETGDVEGRNLAIEYRFADGQNDRLRAIFTELIRRQVLVIVLAGFGAVLHSVRASPIPIVFNTGDDPIQTGPLWTGFRRSEEGRRACEFF